MEKCPSCGKEFVKKPCKNVDGSINWKNMLLPDWYTLWIVVSILFILIGTKIIIEDCKYCLADPCGFADGLGCHRSFGLFSFNLSLINDSVSGSPCPSNSSISEDDLNR